MRGKKEGVKRIYIFVSLPEQGLAILAFDHNIPSSGVSERCHIFSESIQDVCALA